MFWGLVYGFAEIKEAERTPLVIRGAQADAKTSNNIKERMQNRSET